MRERPVADARSGSGRSVRASCGLLRRAMVSATSRLWQRTQLFCSDARVAVA